MTAQPHPKSSSALIPLAGMEAIELAADPAASVVLCCERAKTWLAQALAGDHIEAIVELKSQAEAIRVYTIQKGCGKDAELAAAEVVRRAERCIGVAIRKGQAEGRIAKRGDIGASGGKLDQIRGGDLARPGQYMPNSNELADAYAMADRASDADFDSAIEEAKAERNLSRANVVRNVKRVDGDNRWARFEDLIAAGHTSDQIARKIGVTRETVTKRAKSLGIEITADRVVGRSRRLNHDRVLSEFVSTVESLVPSCELIDLAKVSPDILQDSLVHLSKALAHLRRFQTRLKKGFSNG